jgi:hypothetical protein
MFRSVLGFKCAKVLVWRRRGNPDQSSLIKSKEGSLMSMVKTCFVVILMIWRCIYSSYFLRNEAESFLLIPMYISAFPLCKNTNFNPFKV